MALLATMQDQTTEIRPRAFATTHIDPVDRPGFLDRIRQAGIDPTVPFPKNVSLVKVSGFKMIFESGMVLVGSKTDLEERVDIPPTQEDRRGVTIKDTMKTLSGR